MTALPIGAIPPSPRRPVPTPRGSVARWGFAARLGEHLRTSGVRYCAWKGEPKLERFERGDGDLDLLVDRHQMPELVAALTPFGFRAVLPAAPLVVPGVHSFVAPHPEHGVLVHIHVHFQLLLGASGRVQYHLPLERVVLATATWSEGMRVPSPAFAYILHVLHQAVRRTWTPTMRRSPAREPDPAIAMLASRADPAAVDATLRAHFPMVPPDLFAECEEVLLRSTPDAWIAAAPRRLRHALRAHRRDPGLGALVARGWRRVTEAFPAVARATPGSARPASGGAVIALVGGDGAGKSTCAAALVAWAGTVFESVHAHLGRPPRGVTTLASGIVLKAAAWLRRRFGGRAFASLHEHALLLRTLGTARDRARIHARIHRRAARGALVFVERHPASEHESIAGPSTSQGIALDAESRLARLMRRYEQAIYARLARPDLTLVLRLPPDLAVARKPEEPADYVRRRAELVWARAWDRADERPIDASRPLAEVLGELRQRVWQVL